MTLLACAVVLASAALAAWALSGFEIAAGSIRISATDPSRILLQAAALWLLASLIPGSTRLAFFTLLPILAVLAASVLDSSSRRVGDGGEYVAMALSMSRGGAPALLPSELKSIEEDLGRLPGFDNPSLPGPLIGRDGRQDFFHFWLYPLLVAPLAALARLGGIHVNHAFTAANLLLLVSLLYWLVRNGHPLSAAVIGAGPLLWWTDKAHSEVFMFVSLAFAVLLIDGAPALALLASALAAAQNPAALVVVVLCVASLALPGVRRLSPAAIVGSAVIIALPPIYYRWHLGMWSPLSSTISGALPGLRAIVTPLVDPNLGLLVYAPAIVAMACAGVAGQSKRRLLLCLGGGAALLVVFAQSPNMNHGGTPGMSRYALWLLALGVPLVAAGSLRLASRHPATTYAICVVSIVFSIAIFRPASPDRVNHSPNWLAAMLWTRTPALDNPVPEVFSERLSGRDGFGSVPAATAFCEKALIRGDGRTAWWPVPCAPRVAPAQCVTPRALCYVNDGVYRIAPPQAGFGFDPVPEHSWTIDDTRRFDHVLPRLGRELRISRLEDPGGRFAGGQEIEHLYLVEGTTGSAAWVRLVPKPSGPPTLELDLEQPSSVEIFDSTRAPVRGSVSLSAGRHSIELPIPMSLVLVTDAPTFVGRVRADARE